MCKPVPSLSQSVSPGFSSPILFELPSIVEPLPLYELFPAEGPVEVELGSGDGSFIVNYAQAHPGVNFIAIERLQGRLRKILRKAGRAGLANLRGIRIESTYFLEYLLPPHSVSALHLYFPDPWPKRRHSHNRIVNERFPMLCARALGPGGRVYLRTDAPGYFEVMLETFSTSSEFVAKESPADLLAFTTDFQKEFEARGVATYNACFVRNWSAARADSPAAEKRGG